VGDGHVNRVQVAPGITEGVNIPGGRLLDVGPRGTTRYYGSTGLRAGAGTDTGVGRARITLAHVATGFGPLPGSITHAASGLATGASSAAQDTVLGFSHAVTLAVDGAGTGGTVSLNGGPQIAFTTGDTDLRVTGPDGEVVHLDLSAVTAGFNGQVPLISIGSIALGSGTPQNIDFAATSHRLTAPDGSVTWVDLTGVTQAGRADVVYDGSLDAVNSLLAIRDLLREAGSDTALRQGLDEARDLLQDFDRGTESVLRALTETGAASERLFGLDGRMAEIEVSVAARRSEIEDADLPALIAEMQENEATYQSSLLVTARLGRLSLLDYLG
jgi:flagellin-like hook-associated protein FlgL